jgi:hypothetical protein
MARVSSNQRHADFHPVRPHVVDGGGRTGALRTVERTLSQLVFGFDVPTVCHKTKA